MMGDADGIGCGAEVATDDGINVGVVEELGKRLPSNVGHPDAEGCAEGSPLGMLDPEGLMDG